MDRNFHLSREKKLRETELIHFLFCSIYTRLLLKRIVVPRKCENYKITSKIMKLGQLKRAHYVSLPANK